jgi:hypothetical protein
MVQLRLGVLTLVVVACGSGSDTRPSDSGTDAKADATTIDAATDAATDAPQSCLDAGHEAADRYPVGDNCNFCDCMADGMSLCTTRTCPADGPTCMYNGTTHTYAERFPATDGENECVCAASGLACTRRGVGLPEEGAILLESLDEVCGDDTEFTGKAVLAGLPVDDFTTAFPYETARPLYPETLADSSVRVRIVYDSGFVVCRIPQPTQPAIDMEVTVEVMTADGAFNEGFHTYLRRNNFGFVDAWLTVASAPVGGLDGTYDPSCLDAKGLSFSAQVNADGTAEGRVSKICETDILLDVARFNYEP